MRRRRSRPRPSSRRRRRARARLRPRGRPQRTALWRSADGLNWTRDDGQRDPGGRDSYYATDIAGDGGIVVLSPAESAIGGPFQFPTYAWSSTNGVEWNLIEPDGSYVTEVVTIGSTTVAVGTIGRGDEAAFWVLER